MKFLLKRKTKENDFKEKKKESLLYKKKKF